MDLLKPPPSGLNNTGTLPLFCITCFIFLFYIRVFRWTTEIVSHLSEKDGAWKDINDDEKSITIKEIAKGIFLQVIAEKLGRGHG